MLIIKNFSKSKRGGLLVKYLWALAAAALMLFMFASVAISGPRVVDRIVAVVNDDIIRLNQLDKELKPFKEKLDSENIGDEQKRERLYEARMQLLDELINETLADQQILETGIQVDDAEVDAAIEQVKSRNYYTDEDLRRALNLQGLSMEDYRRELRSQILRSRLVNRKVKSSIVITPEDIRRYYESHPEKYGGEIKYKLRNIVLPGPESGTDASITRRLIEDIRAQAEAGASFSELAQKYSRAPNAEDGGALGEFSIEDLARELRPVISDLKEGEFSDVIETQQGVQLFYVEEIVQTQPEPLESVEDEIEEKLYNQQVDEKYRAWLQSLREESHIRIIR